MSVRKEEEGGKKRAAVHVCHGGTDCGGGGGERGEGDKLNVIKTGGGREEEKNEEVMEFYPTKSPFKKEKKGKGGENHYRGRSIYRGEGVYSCLKEREGGGARVLKKLAGEGGGEDAGCI